jgi:hypothetical protein
MTIDAQIKDMAFVWPTFRLIGREGATAAWQGAVRPLLQTFVVDITYRAPSIIEQLNLRVLQPRVRILSPPLRRRPGDPEGSLPHVYYSANGDVILCMLDPDSDDWSPFDSLAQTTVPWIIDWLAAYEGWRATGEWTASGRHVAAGGAGV